MGKPKNGNSKGKQRAAATVADTASSTTTPATDSTTIAATVSDATPTPSTALSLQEQLREMSLKLEALQQAF